MTDENLQKHLKYKTKVCKRYECLVCEAKFVSEKKLHEHVEMEKHPQRELELEEQVVPSESGNDHDIEFDNPILDIDLEIPLAHIEIELIYID